MPLWVFTFFGVLFGFVLSRARVTDYDTIASMFRLTDLHLFGVIGAAIPTAALGLWALRRAGNRTLAGGAADIRPKPWNRGAIWGGLLFGAGWALTGACPGTALAQVGEGKLIASFSVIGILLGTYLYGWTRSLPDATGRHPIARTAR